MTFLANTLLVACLGLMPEGPVPGLRGNTPAVVPDGGTVRLGLKVPDGGTVLLGGLKTIPPDGGTVRLGLKVPDGGTVLLGGLKRLR
jgi:hypothetical protein